MSLLSKAETEFLKRQKQVSKSYEYKLKSIIKKKLSVLIDQELPLIISLFPNIDLTKFSKHQNKDKGSDDLTNNSKIVSSHLSIKRDYNKGSDIIPQESIKTITNLHTALLERIMNNYI